MIAGEESPYSTYHRLYAEEHVKRAVRDAGCFVRGHFRFASETDATHKIDMSILKDHPEQLGMVRRFLATHETFYAADVILAVPDGAQDLFAQYLSNELHIPWAQLEKVPHGTRYEFCFKTDEDRTMALQAQHPRIIEDVVTTLGSVAGVVGLLEPDRQEVQSLAVWRRGVVNPAYRVGLSADHYLVEEEVPLD